MRDCEQPDEAACGPEALLQLVIDTASAHGVAVTGENALQRYVLHSVSHPANQVHSALLQSGSVHCVELVQCSSAEARK